MDIKDFILIAGGLLILAVIAHGFWIAWRARQEPLRLDIAPDLIPDDVSDIERFRGELPNGGARVVDPPNRRRSRSRSVADGYQPEQTRLELDAEVPVLLEKSETPVSDRSSVRTVKRKPSQPQLLQPDEVDAELFGQPPITTHEHRPRVADVSMPPEALESPIVAEGLPRDRDASLRVRREERPPAAKPQVRQPRRLMSKKTPEVEEPAAQAPKVEELIVVHALAAKGQPFVGADLFDVLRGRGLRFGDMNIFHRVDPMMKASLYSVANAVEPGVFDLSNLDEFTSPGVTFFLQLPGPEQPLEAFEDLIAVARDVTLHLGGELKDEKMGVLTGQTVEHLRQRIADYARRQMSKRA